MNERFSISQAFSSFSPLASKNGERMNGKTKYSIIAMPTDYDDNENYFFIFQSHFFPVSPFNFRLISPPGV